MIAQKKVRPRGKLETDKETKPIGVDRQQRLLNLLQELTGWIRLRRRRVTPVETRIT